MKFYVIISLFVKFYGCCYAEDEKRILLSDPQYSHGIEATLQTLTSRIDHLETQHQADISRIETKHQADISQCQLENQQLRLEYKDLQTQTLGNISLAKSSLYTRWGRKTCPSLNGTELVYTGYTGGANFQHAGGAANFLCMPSDPELLPTHSTTNYVYGVEYDRNLNGNNANDDAPCSVCHTQRAAILMLPGRQHCYHGWVMEYTGILVAGHYAQAAASEYICLDSAPEALVHGAQDDEQGLLYHVNSKCGSLPCPPYKDEATLPCVVCSK